VRAPSGHREIPVKVTAWVDEGVAPLVVALNEFDQVLTVGSCEGDPDKGAYVLFCFQGDTEQATDFAAELGEALSGHDVPYLLRAEWRAGSSEPLLALTCPPDSVLPLAEAVSAARKWLSPGDTGRIAPRNSRASRPLQPAQRCGDGSAS
jgi:hypothetical protein